MVWEGSKHTFSGNVPFWSKSSFLEQNQVFDAKCILQDFHGNCDFSDFDLKSSILSKGLLGFGANSIIYGILVEIHLRKLKPENIMNI